MPRFLLLKMADDPATDEMINHIEKEGGFISVSAGEMIVSIDAELLSASRYLVDMED